MSALFPELDEAEGSSLERTDAGGEGLATLAILLALPARARAQPPTIVAATAIGDVRLELRLEGGGVQPVTLHLDTDTRAAAAARNDHFAVWFAAERADPRHAALARWVAHRLRRVPLGIVLRALRSDPASRASAPASAGDDGATTASACEPHTLAARESSDSLFHSYAHDRNWRTFIEGRELHRGYGGSIRGNVRTVLHADLECRYNTVDGWNSPFSLVNSLATDRHGPTRPGDDDNLRRPDLVTDPSDIEVIKGVGAVLDRVLDAVARESRPPALVLVQNSCLSEVVGDDVDVSLERLRRVRSIAGLNLGMAVSPLHELLRVLPRPTSEAPPVSTTDSARGTRAETARVSTTDAAHRAGPARVRASVNIVGLPRLPGHEELLEALDAAGIAINAWVLPDLDLRALRRYPAAELSVLYECDFNASAYRALHEAMPMPVVTPPAPYGPRRARAWLVAIAERLGRTTEMAGVLDTQLAPATEAWSALTREARHYRLGFIGDDASLRRITDPSALLGVPLLPLLEEMGFGIDVLRYRAPHRRSAPPPIPGPHVRTVEFDSPTSLEAALCASDAVAFYSELGYDRRLTRTGRNVFSLKDVEIGLTGACNTLRRWIARCQLPFYRTYGRYLGSAFGVGAAAAVPTAREDSSASESS